MNASFPTAPGAPPDRAAAAGVLQAGVPGAAGLSSEDAVAGWVPGSHDLIPLLPRGRALFEAIPARAIVVEALSPAIGNGAVIARRPGSVGVILVKNGSLFEEYAFEDGTWIDGEQAVRAIRDWDDATVSAFQFDPIVVAVAPSLIRGTPCYEDLRLEWTDWRGLLADLCRRDGLYVVELDTPVGRGVTLILDGRQVAAYTEIHPEIGDERLLDPLAATGHGTIWVRREPEGSERISLDLVMPAPAPGETAGVAYAVAEPEATPEPEAVSEPEVVSEPEAVLAPEAVVESEAVAEPEAVAEAEAAAEPQAADEPEVEEEDVEIDWSALPPWRAEGVGEALGTPLEESPAEEAPRFDGGVGEAEPAGYAVAPEAPGVYGEPPSLEPEDPFAAFRMPTTPEPEAEPADPFAVFRTPIEGPPPVPSWDAFDATPPPPYQPGPALPLAAVAADLKAVARLRLQRSSPRVEAMVDEAAARDLPLDALLDEIRGLVIRGVMQSTLDDLVAEMMAIAAPPSA